MKTQPLSSGAQAPPSCIQSGSQIIVDTLRDLGVEVVFGYLGASVMPLFDGLYRQETEPAGFVPLPRPAILRRRAGELNPPVRNDPYSIRRSL